jgi:protein-S-isoprenylcysteine O-methyltransferase Ste14
MRRAGLRGDEAVGVRPANMGGVSTRRRDGTPMALPLKLTVVVLGWMSLLAAVLFVPAGTIHWWRAWVFIGLMLAGTAYAVASLLPGHRALIEERLRPPIQREQPLTDKIVLTAFLAAFYGWLAFISLDVFRFHLLGTPAPPVSWLGLALLVAGWTVAYLAVRENAFAAIVVKHSPQQRVIDTGVYGVVRHPMYAGSVLLLLGIPLWLQSYAGLLAALVPIAAMGARAVEEERFLRRELGGYDAYAARIRYRLVPFVW